MKNRLFTIYILSFIFFSCNNEVTNLKVVELNNTKWKYNYPEYDYFFGNTQHIHFLSHNIMEIYGLSYTGIADWKVDGQHLTISNISVDPVFDNLPENMYSYDQELFEYLESNEFLAICDSSLFISSDTSQPIFFRTYSLPKYCCEVQESLSGLPGTIDVTNLIGSWILQHASDGWGGHCYYPDSLVFKYNYTYQMYMTDCLYESGIFSVDSVLQEDNHSTDYLVSFITSDKGSFTQLLGFGLYSLYRLRVQNKDDLLVRKYEVWDGMIYSFTKHESIKQKIDNKIL